MIPSSQKLATLRDALLGNAVAGGSIQPRVTGDICALLDYIIADVEQMEKRLTGDLPVSGDIEGGNIVSLVARALAAQDHQPGGTP